MRSESAIAIYVANIHKAERVLEMPIGASPLFCNNCTDVITGSGIPSSDGSGYSYNGISVISKDGKQISVPVNNQTSGGKITDSNGNEITNNGNGTFTDTLGKTALTITGSGTAASPPACSPTARRPDLLL